MRQLNIFCSNYGISTKIIWNTAKFFESGEFLTHLGLEMLTHLKMICLMDFSLHLILKVLSKGPLLREGMKKNLGKLFAQHFHISRTTELTKSYLFIYLFTLSVGLKYEVVSRSAECCTQFSRERDQQSAYFPTDDIFLNFGSNSRLAVYSKPDSVWLI